MIKRQNIESGSTAMCSIAITTALKPLKHFHPRMNVIMALSHEPLRFPIELLHKILTHVVGNSIHAICIFPGDVNWELRIFETLCGVSSSFKAITTELFIKGFKIPPDESEKSFSVP